MIDGIDNPIDLYYFMKSNIKYGFVSQSGEKFIRVKADGQLYLEIIISHNIFQI